MSDERWLAPLSVREEPLPDGQVPRAAPYRVRARPFPRNPAHRADDTGREREMAPRLLDSPPSPHPRSLRFPRVPLTRPSPPSAGTRRARLVQ